MHSIDKTIFAGLALTVDFTLEAFVTSALRSTVIPSRFGQQVTSHLSMWNVTLASMVDVIFAGDNLGQQGLHGEYHPRQKEEQRNSPT